MYKIGWMGGRVQKSFSRTDPSIQLTHRWALSYNLYGRFSVLIMVLNSDIFLLKCFWWSKNPQVTFYIEKLQLLIISVVIRFATLFTL